MFWPDIDVEVYDEDEDSYAPRNVRCRHCRQSGFTWKQTSTGWMMQDQHGILHTCLRDARKEKMREYSKERTEHFHEVSKIFNGTNPSIDDINRMLIDAATADRRDRYFGSGR
jgi:hypothetical protein